MGVVCLRITYLYTGIWFLSGVNLLIGTDSGLMLLDRSGQGKGNCFISLRFQPFCDSVSMKELK